MQQQQAVLPGYVPRKLGGDPFKDPSIGLILGPGEEVKAHLDGERKQDGCFKHFLLTVLTLGIYLCIYRKTVASIVVTKYRTIFFRREISDSNEILCFDQTAFYNVYLAGGDLTYKQPEQNICAKFCGCCVAKPFLQVSLDFQKYQQDDLAQGAKSPAQFVTKCCIKKNKNRGSAEYDIDSLFVNVVEKREESYPKGIRFMTAVLTESGVKKTIVAAPNHRVLVFTDAQQQITNPEIQVPINRLMFPFGHDEIIIEGINATPASCCEDFRVGCLSIITFGIYYFLYLNCFKYERGYVIVTDRRLVNIRFFTKGKNGTFNPNNSFEADTRFWMADQYKGGEMTMTRGGLSSCNLPCICSNYKAVVLTLDTKKGPISFNPSFSDKIGTERIRQFVHAALSVNMAVPLAGFSPTTNVNAATLPDLILLEGERILADADVERLSACESIMRIFCWVATIGLFPTVTPTRLLVTTHRMIQVASEAYCLCRDSPISTTQSFHPLRRVVRTTVTKDRCCGCGTCFSFGNKTYLGIVYKKDEFPESYSTESMETSNKALEAIAYYLSMVHFGESQVKQLTQAL